MTDQQLEELDEQARMYAYELVGPNDPDFEAVWESRLDELIDEFEAKENPA